MLKNHPHGKTKNIFALLKLNLSFIIWGFSKAGVIVH